MSEKTVLIVDDETAIREMIAVALEMADYKCLEASNAKDAYMAIVDQRPDMILLDWMLPETSGIELARRLKRNESTSEIPIIMLTAKTEEDNKVQGLEVGADDYITKPFSPRELIARINAVLRRSSTDIEEKSIVYDGLSLDPIGHRVEVDDTPLNLAPTEFRLLHFFMSNPDRVYSREQLLDYVWGRGVFVEERTVDVHIRRLRKALNDRGYDRFIQTVRGAGYRFSTRG